MRLRSGMGVCLVFIVLGCGSQGAPVERMPVGEVSGIAPSAEVRRMRLPFDDYGIGARDMAKLSHAAEVLTERCMLGKHLGWATLPPYPVQDANHRRRYGVIEEEVARRIGYHMADDPVVVENNRREALRNKGLSASQSAAAYGPDGNSGCVKEAWIRIGRYNDSSDKAFVWRLSGESLEFAKNHADVKPLLRRWSLCMNSRGFRYDDPWASAGDARWWKSGRSTRDEIAAAVADVQCKKETRLVSALARVETAFQKDMLEKHGERFAVIKDHYRRWMDDVESIAATASDG